MKETNTSTESAPVKVGDKVNFSPCPAQLPNWGIRFKVGVVELVRRRFDGRLEAYVVVNKTRWLFPVAWLAKEVK
jgi:hypothetical protein